MKKSNFSFELSSEIEYQTESGNKKTKNLVLIAPSPEKNEKVEKLRKRLTNAVTTMGQNSGNSGHNSSDSDKNINIEQSTIILFAITSLSDEKCADFKSIFFDLLISGCCLVDGKVELTDWHIKQLDLDDRDLIMGEYIANFIMPSWLKKIMTK